jgi:hypothetical protein
MLKRAVAKQKRGLFAAKIVSLLFAFPQATFALNKAVFQAGSYHSASR